ncbi:hypothetical protein NQ314_000570 [Rhamnusium bicolor]|uniref:ARID domain-containing protein n=1 Tax=Rhamnusium bicolor TaxID=1586634 RepID=A0AAV8ZUN6_9CUCU|nr:hypothetical protein NQ314_000570 [Rhamnusium bicolor]
MIKTMDEVLAISEKVVIRVEDLITWITVEAEWTWGRLAKCEEDLKDVEVELSKCAPPRKPTGTSFTLTESTLDFSDVENERKTLDPFKENTGQPHVIILSFPKYCRYRAMMKRLEDVENLYLKYKIVNALGGFYVIHPNTRVLFCKETFDYPELEGHELLCNHLAPKLKGRPRGKRKKRSVSPGSESNESESSVTNSYNTRAESRNGLGCDSGITPRRSTRCHENNENKEFVRKLTVFMKSNHTPIGRIPSLGYKELNLHEFFTKVQKLGGYDAVTTNRLWKSIFDDMSGHQNSTSAATVIRRHYERTEGKPSSLRSVRVKPERQKDKQVNSEKVSVQNNNNNSIDQQPSVKKEKEDSKPEVKPKIEKLIIKTESMTVKTEYANIKIENTSEKIECTTIKSEQVTLKSEKSHMKADIIPVKAESKPVKLDPSVMKAEIVPVKMEPIKHEKSEIKMEAVAIKSESTNIPEKNAEPLTSAATPVAQKVSPDKLMSPVEGKENIPLIKTGDTATKNSPEIIEVPYKPKVPEVVNVESDAYKGISSTFIHEVKKRKLDILKEGGLEVTPVRPTMTNLPNKDGRPTVIQQITPPAQIISKHSKQEIMPPPAINTVPPKRMNITIPQALNISQVKVSPATPIKPVKPVPVPSTNSFPFANRSTPPKVVQSKSIYSYSEKTVYGNPKDILCPTIKSAVHTPKFISTIPRQNGGDPVDLSVNSPQKPIVEIMRIPQSPSASSYTPYNRDTVTKNLYKTTSTPIMDGRRLGPNLEITLVGPNNKNSTHNLQKQYNYPPAQLHSSQSNSQFQHQKRFSSDYYSPNKMSKNDENGKYNKHIFLPPHRDSKSNIDISIPNPYTNKSPSIKADPINSHMKQMSQSQSAIKHFPNHNLPAFSPYLTQMYEGNKGIPPYLPLIDPAMYYSAAMQSLYTSSALSSAAPMLPIPTPEQLKFYTELMAHGRLNFPFQLPQDSNQAINNNNLKKP